VRRALVILLGFILVLALGLLELHPRRHRSGADSGADQDQ